MLVICVKTTPGAPDPACYFQCSFDAGSPWTESIDINDFPHRKPSQHRRDLSFCRKSTASRSFSLMEEHSKLPMKSINLIDVANQHQTRGSSSSELLDPNQHQRRQARRANLLGLTSIRGGKPLLLGVAMIVACANQHQRRPSLPKL